MINFEAQPEWVELQFASLLITWTTFKNNNFFAVSVLGWGRADGSLVKVADEFGILGAFGQVRD